MLSKDIAEKWMRLAIEEAKKAAERGDEPFGAVLLDGCGNLVCSAGNRENSENNPCMHAETTLIREACKKLNTKDLSGYIVVANAECCPMCASALTLAGIREFYIGAQMEGFCNPYIRLQEILNKTVWETKVTFGILEEECKNMIAEARSKKQASDLSLKIKENNMSNKIEINLEELEKVSGGKDDGKSYTLYYRETELDTDKTVQETMDLYPELKALETQFPIIKSYKNTKLSTLCKALGEDKMQELLDDAIGYERVSK